LDAATARMVAALDELTPATNATLCLVSHGGILRLAAGYLLGLPVLEAWALDVDNASVSRLNRRAADDAWRIAAWNDTAHLLGHAELRQDEAEGAPLAL
ncbi:MAG TPA: histidine phosphatase family protein, partial [Candidatus Limnocylindria bacterium]